MRRMLLALLAAVGVSCGMVVPVVAQENNAVIIRKENIFTPDDPSFWYRIHHGRVNLLSPFGAENLVKCSVSMYAYYDTCWQADQNGNLVELEEIKTEVGWVYRFPGYKKFVVDKSRDAADPLNLAFYNIVDLLHPVENDNQHVFRTTILMSVLNIFNSNFFSFGDLHRAPFIACLQNENDNYEQCWMQEDWATVPMKLHRQKFLNSFIYTL